MLNLALESTGYEVQIVGREPAPTPGKAVPPPKELPAFPEARRVDPKTGVGQTGRMRRRWKEPDGTIYEWDYQHGQVEKYDKRGVHQGEFDYRTGKQLKRASATRRVEP